MEYYIWLLEIILGLLLGAFIPLFFFYIIYFVKKRKRAGMKIALPLIIRLIAFLFIYFLLFALLSWFYTNIIATKEITEDEKDSLVLGIAGMSGFLLGIVLFIVGFTRGRKSKRKIIST